MGFMCNTLAASWDSHSEHAVTISTFSLHLYQFSIKGDDTVMLDHTYIFLPTVSHRQQNTCAYASALEGRLTIHIE
jgi:hypothetical protein